MVAADYESILTQECAVRGYSEKTMRSYLFHVKKFLDSKMKPKEYLYLLIKKEKSDETIRAACFAIKFYLSIIKKEDDEFSQVLTELPNVKREKKLPIILSKQEVEMLISATKNINHRLIIQLGYSSGLRVSEIINLKWQDIDFDRNLIHLKRAKGKKTELLCFR
ncbi:MAG: tyrosine-type recombinase/integrase [Candidatus Woesearchaeota archaeon]